MAEIKATLTGKDKIYLNRSLNGSIWKVILSVGTPLALYQGLNALFVILDTMMASQISKESVSAVAYLAQINYMISAVGGGLAVGAGIQISRAYGEGNLQLVRKRVSTLYVICVAVGLALLLLILPFTNGFLRLAGTPEELIEVGAKYFIVEMICMVVTFLNNVYIAVERARGNSRRIMYLNFIVIALKLSLTALFVYVMKSDLVMIAVATLISQVVLLLFGLRNSIKGDGAFCFSKKAIELRGETTGPMIRNSIPIILEKGLFAFGKTVINSMSTVYGPTMVGALGVSNNLGGITTNPQNGYQEGTAAVISQNYGAGKYERVIHAFYAGLVINVLIGALISGLEIWQMDLLAGFFDSGSNEFHREIIDIYRYEALGAIPLGINAAVMSLLYGLGKTRITLLINFSRVFIFRIPVFWCLQNLTSLGSKSVGIVMLVSNLSTGIMAAIVGGVVIYGFKNSR